MKKTWKPFDITLWETLFERLFCILKGQHTIYYSVKVADAMKIGEYPNNENVV